MKRNETERIKEGKDLKKKIEKEEEEEKKIERKFFTKFRFWNRWKMQMEMHLFPTTFNNFLHLLLLQQNLHTNIAP